MSVKTLVGIPAQCWGLLLVHRWQGAHKPLGMHHSSLSGGLRGNDSVRLVSATSVQDLDEVSGVPVNVSTPYTGQESRGQCATHQFVGALTVPPVCTPNSAYALCTVSCMQANAEQCTATFQGSTSLVTSTWKKRVGRPPGSSSPADPFAAARKHPLRAATPSVGTRRHGKRADWLSCSCSLRWQLKDKPKFVA